MKNSTERIKANQDAVNWGHGANQVKALSMPYDPTASGIPANEVQTAIDLIAAMATAVPVAQTAFVDDTNGDDATGVVGDMEKPYKTMPAALAAIGDNAADKQYVVDVANGTYTAAFTTKPYVHIRCADGVIVSPAAGTVITGGMNMTFTGGDFRAVLDATVFSITDSGKPHMFRSKLTGLVVGTANTELHLRDCSLTHNHTDDKILDSATPWIYADSNSELLGEITGNPSLFLDSSKWDNIKDGMEISLLVSRNSIITNGGGKCLNSNFYGGSLTTGGVFWSVNGLIAIGTVFEITPEFISQAQTECVGCKMKCAGIDFFAETPDTNGYIVGCEIEDTWRVCFTVGNNSNMLISGNSIKGLLNLSALGGATGEILLSGNNFDGKIIIFAGSLCFAGDIITGDLDVDAASNCSLDASVQVLGDIIGTGAPILVTDEARILSARHETWVLPKAAEVITLLAAKAANGNAAPGNQCGAPRNVRCKLAAGAGSVDVTVTITGILANGVASTEVISVTGANGDYDGDKAFASISDIAYTGTWDGGNITFYTGTKLGLGLMPIDSVYKEVFNGANQAIGTVDAANATYIPTGALDGLKGLEVWYENRP